MVDLQHVPLLGRVVAWAGALLDVVLNSGELVFVLFGFVLDNFPLLYSLVRTLESLAERFEWLPVGLLDSLVTVVLVAALVSYAGRLAKQGAQRL